MTTAVKNGTERADRIGADGFPAFTVVPVGVARSDPTIAVGVKVQVNY